MQRNDKEYGNGDGKVDINEAYKSLKIGLMLLMNQGSKDAEKIKASSDGMKETLAKYSGADGTFSAQEWAEFLNGKEWGRVLDDFNASSGRAKLEMSWIDQVHNNDGKVTIGEIGSSLWNNLVTNVHKPSESQHKFITETLKKYAKDDGIFSLEEYQALKQDKEYETFIQKNDLTAWYIGINVDNS